jgi:hypothetical protein
MTNNCKFNVLNFVEICPVDVASFGLLTGRHIQHTNEMIHSVGLLILTRHEISQKLSNLITEAQNVIPSDKNLSRVSILFVTLQLRVQDLMNLREFVPL